MARLCVHLLCKLNCQWDVIDRLCHASASNFQRRYTRLVYSQLVDEFAARNVSAPDECRQLAQVELKLETGRPKADGDRQANRMQQLRQNKDVFVYGTPVISTTTARQNGEMKKVLSSGQASFICNDRLFATVVVVASVRRTFGR